MKLEIATLSDIDHVLLLQRKYHIDSIDESQKKDGFVTTAFSREQLHELIVKERGLFVAKSDDIVVGYAMAASWEYWQRWPIFAFMIKELHRFEFDGRPLSTDNSYQYGPICVDRAVRGSGLFEKLFAFSLRAMSARYPVLVTFINKINERSFAAHTQKAGLTVLTEFQFNGNHYYWLVCKTNRSFVC